MNTTKGRNRAPDIPAQPALQVGRVAHKIGDRLRRAAKTLATNRAKRSLTHEERRELINRPFPSFRVIPPHTWAGALISHPELPTEGRRVYSPRPEDEEFGRIHDEIMKFLED